MLTKMEGRGIKKQTDPESYKIELEPEMAVRLHVDQDGRAG